MILRFFTIGDDINDIFKDVKKVLFIQTFFTRQAILLNMVLNVLILVKVLQSLLINLLPIRFLILKYFFVFILIS